MLTKRQKQIFDYIKKFIKAKSYAPSLDEIRRHFRLSSKSTIYQHIEALKIKGYLAKLDHRARAIEILENKKTKLAEIPLLGTIAAGEPIEAIENPDTILVPQDYIGKYGDYYALRVQGNSMIDQGVFDGDTVIIREQKTADNGQMVVAIIDDNQATLKKIYQEKDRIRLQPANPSLFPIYRKEVEIRGIVAQIIRNLESQLEGDRLKRRIDYSWDFNGAKTKPHSHGFHTYPAMFIPQVARRLLLTYSQKGDTICDIFCGSGTALIESRLLSRNSYGIDLNPLAVFLAKVKTTSLNPQLLAKEHIKLIARINKIKNTETKRPKFKNLEFWFKNKVIIELAKIKKAVKEIRNKKIQDFFMVAFSETVRKSSNTKNGEFKLVRIKKEDLEKHNPDVSEIFKQKVESNIKAMTEFYRDIDKNTWAKIMLGDSSKNNGIKENSIDCIITSPPYSDSRTTVAYGQFSRLSAQWLGIFDNPDNASGVDKELLGGKAVKKLSSSLASNYLSESLKKIAEKDEKRAKDVLSFYLDLNGCLIQAYKMLKPKKYFCIVIGNRLVKQIRIPTDFIIIELAQKIGFTCEDIFVRNIPGKRMPIKNSPTNIIGELEETITKESVVILRKF